MTSLISRLLWVSFASSVLAGCVSETVRIVDMTPPRQAETLIAEEQLLDVGVAIFDANVPDDYDTRIDELIMPEVRRAEAQYFPYFFKNLLQSTGNWGAVRVVPRATDAVDVSVEGKILESNGETLAVQATVTDASGRQWFSKTYTSLASKYSYEDSIPASIDAFQSFYKDLANDMLDYLEQLEAAEVVQIRNIAEMKFARGFSPDAFADHVEANAKGVYTLKRLPAADDPMLMRVRQVREREYLFIDTLEEYYTNFYRQMYPHYQAWRKASYDQAIAYNQLKAQARARTISGTLAIVGGVASIYESNNPYVDASGLVSIVSGATLITTAVQKRHEAELQAERLRELGSDAEAELVPTTLELENQTARLEGSVDQQYEQLRAILRRVYFEDMNLPDPDQEALSEKIGRGSDMDESVTDGTDGHE